MQDQDNTSVNEGADDTDVGNEIISVDHFVSVVSTAPSMSGEIAQLYVRERVLTSIPDSLEGQVVLFIHGAGTPAEVGFDVPYSGHSWMAYLAELGMDVFAMDTTGYGRSTRPLVMNDRCNLSAQQQEELFGDSCSSSYPYAATTMTSDWHDIDAVVDYLRELRGVGTVHLVGWSQGGPRSAGYAALNPEKVGNIVLLAPAYSRQLPATEAQAEIAGAVFTKQSHDDFVNNWNRQVGCSDQYDPAVSDAVWAAMLDSDPVGATWGSGVRRAPRTPTFGWTSIEVANTLTPIMMVAGTHDAQVSPERVQDMYADLGSDKKVYIEMSCSSHNAMWEKDAEQLFDASYQWLTSTSYNGIDNGMLEMEE
ncbi:alpha/beta fold hydrolase [Gammaproteobacteria bacterium AH-315-E17]|nr:alpha/beta fold hydrolase [Gammaproteobacteria bacterium AH-315-E17]